MKHQAGFTLLELTVATIIGLLIAITAVACLHTITLGKERSESMTLAADQLRYAVDCIATDLANLSRQDLDSAKFICRPSDDRIEAESQVIFYTISHTPAREDYPESDVYQVEYYVDHENDRSILYRRCCPNPDKENETSGILTRIGDYIAGFTIRCYDGKDWFTEWTEEQQKLPELIELTMAVQPKGDEPPIVQSRLIRFDRWPQQQTTSNPNEHNEQ